MVYVESLPAAPSTKVHLPPETGCVYPKITPSMISKMSHSGGQRDELVSQYAGQKPLPAGTRTRASK